MLKIGPLRVFHIFVQGSHTFGKFYTHVLREKRGISVLHAHIVDNLAQNRTVGSMLVLYDSTMHLATPKPYLMHVATL